MQGKGTSFNLPFLQPSVASSDCLPNQSSHSTARTVWDLVSHHSAWIQLDNGRFPLSRHGHPSKSHSPPLYRFEINIQMMMFSSFVAHCAHLWNLQSLLKVSIMLPFHLEFFQKCFYPFTNHFHPCLPPQPAPGLAKEINSSTLGFFWQAERRSQIAKHC